VNTFGSSHVQLNDGQIAAKIHQIFPMRPYDIEQRLQLRKPIYSDTASYGHMGRTPEKKVVTFVDGSGKEKTIKFETFTWEKLDKVSEIRKAFNLK
jgi:S-adenosylmethionine synthetase